MQYPNIEVATAQPSTINLPATTPPAVQAAIDPTERIYPRGFFYQKGKYWSTEQVHAFNCASEKDVAPSDLLGKFFPVDEKTLECFKELIEKFIAPTKNEILDYLNVPHKSPIRDNELRNVFHTLSYIHDRDENYDEVPSTIDDILNALGLRMDIYKYNLSINKYNIRYNLAKLNMKGVLHCNGGIYHLKDRHQQWPLAVLLDTYNLTTRKARNNLFSCLLLPLAIKYEQQIQKRDTYVSFCITASLSKYRVTRAEASHTYFEDLRHGRRIKEKLVIQRGKEYDLLKEEDRGEFLKMYWGICSFLTEIPEGSM
ncbi:hypothetical protein AbraIFM66950_000150 [Aspergillus brasiliensis]|nr:hypothetical protein AbraIFM66950_000150 [Aspergillus brasiliensis]